MLIHGYFDVDWEAVWQVVQRDLPVLTPQIQRILAKSKTQYERTH